MLDGFYCTNALALASDANWASKTRGSARLVNPDRSAQAACHGIAMAFTSPDMPPRPAFIVAGMLSLFASCAAAAEERCIVIDAGHGGTSVLDESSPNNATSASGAKEKDLTLELALAVFTVIRDSPAAKKAGIVPVLTRTADVNVGMTDRARVALSRSARALVSIHFNASTNHTSRGPLGMVQDASHGNHNVARDGAYANRLADAVSGVTRRYDSKSVRRDFITDRELKQGRGSFLLRHLRADPRGQEIPACFLEIEFIDNPAVEAWLIRGEKAKAIRAEIAAALAAALIEYVAKGG